jgi:diguanylate cyclase (GGDEF)-like protein/PAS domain S-box-containing protein
MTDRATGSTGEYGSSAFNLLKQQLISASARLDRQVQQLTRLNRLSNRLLADLDDRPVAETFAEAVVDVLDLAVGAVWVLPTVDDAAADLAVCGADVPAAEWAAFGRAFARELTMRQVQGAVRLESLGFADLPTVELLDAMVCPCIGRDGTVTAVMLAANTPAVAGMFDVVSEDTGEMLVVLAEKCAVAIDDRAGHHLIQHQLEQLRASEERLGLVLRGTNDGWWDWDLREGDCFQSARWLEMIGLPSHDGGYPPRGHPFWIDRVHPDERAAFQVTLERALDGAIDKIETELRLRREDDTYLPVLVRGTISRASDGLPTHFAGSILDLTERKVHEERIHRLAFYDSLTDLPNRRLLVERLQQALHAWTLHGQASAVLMLDLDRFKTLNDTHGHAAGDHLLRAVGRRLVETVRSFDMVARLSGDEFVVLLEHLGPDSVSAAAAASEVAHVVLAALDAPYTLDVGVVHYSASIGVMIAAEHGLTVDTVLKNADVALYQAKESGRNAVRLFHPSMQLRVATRSALEARLRDGIRQHELHMWYQPIVDEHGVLVAAEALMRWSPANDRPVPPSEFIPIAEESGIIHALGQWGLETVCEQLSAWGPLVPDGFRVAVNLSAPEFLHPNFIARILDTMERTGVPGRALRLEITEATVVKELGFAAERMNSLRAHDIEFALDDFGTGYSSLTYLRRLPVSEVKIDRSYVRRLLHDPHDAAIVRAILALCDSLGMRAVAEGVETEAQWRRLLDDGCRLFQGFLFGRPQAPPPDPRHLNGTHPGLARGAAGLVRHPGAVDGAGTIRSS